MTTKSPSSDPSESIPGASPTWAAEEALDIGLVIASVTSLVLTYGLVAWVELNTWLAVVGIIGADAVFVFIIVPHLIAYWLGYDVDVLLSGQSSASK